MSETGTTHGMLTAPISPPCSPPNEPEQDFGHVNNCSEDSTDYASDDSSNDSNNNSEDAEQPDVSRILDSLTTGEPSQSLMSASRAMILEQRITISQLAQTALDNEVKIHNLQHFASLDATRIQDLKDNNYNLARANAKLRTSLADAERDIETLGADNQRLIEDHETAWECAEEMERRLTQELKAAEQRELSLQEHTAEAEEEARMLRAQVNELIDADGRIGEKLEILKQGLEMFESEFKSPMECEW